MLNSILEIQISELDKLKRITPIKSNHLKAISNIYLDVAEYKLGRYQLFLDNLSLYWEDWEIGKEYVSPSRTITEADIVHFAGISGDYNPLHINEEHCKKTIFGTRIAHGPLVYSIAAGLLFQLHLYDDTLIAFLGFDSLKFTRHVIAGDTITAKIIVTEKRETSKTDRGVMKRSLKVFNQNDEMVQDAIQAFLLKRKP